MPIISIVKFKDTFDIFVVILVSAHPHIVAVCPMFCKKSEPLLIGVSEMQVSGMIKAVFRSRLVCVGRVACLGQ